MDIHHVPGKEATLIIDITSPSVEIKLMMMMLMII